MKNRIADLRDHLFETLEALKDTEKPMDLDRAQAIADVARVIVDTAKVEVAFIKVAGDLPPAAILRGTGFIPGAENGADPAVRRLNGGATPAPPPRSRT